MILARARGKRGKPMSEDETHDMPNMPAVFDAVLRAVIGDDNGGCCGCVDEEEECCMAEDARRVFAAIESAGGPSLAQMQAMADSNLTLAENERYALALDAARTFFPDRYWEFRVCVGEQGARDFQFLIFADRDDEEPSSICTHHDPVECVRLAVRAERTPKTGNRPSEASATARRA